jgi:hypothetical protein
MFVDRGRSVVGVGGGCALVGVLTAAGTDQGPDATNGVGVPDTAEHKAKARYMNLGELVSWGQRTLRYLHMPPESRQPAVMPNRLEAKLGWLREYREALGQWRGMLAVVEKTLEIIRQDGYHREAARVLGERLACLAQDEVSRRVAERAVAFVAEQSSAAVGEEHLPGSTECLESLIGKAKRLEGQQSRSGFTKMVLGMAASVVEPTVEYIRTALEEVKTQNVIRWCTQKLGVSVQARRAAHRHQLAPRRRSQHRLPRLLSVWTHLGHAVAGAAASVVGPVGPAAAGHVVKEVWGAGQQQVRNIWTNVAVYHLNLWMHTLVELWAWSRSHKELCCVSRALIAVAKGDWHRRLDNGVPANTASGDGAWLLLPSSSP